MKRARRCLGSAVLLTMIAGCGGGGGSSTPSALPTPTAHAAPTPAVSAAPGATAQVTIAITIPSRTANGVTRSPKFVSPSAQSVSIAVYPVTGGVIAGSPSSTANQDLTSSSPGCSGGSPNVCLITMGAAVGIDAFGITTYQNIGEGGAILSQLAPTVATERTIVEGVTNVVLPLALSGVPASLAVSAAAATTFTGGNPANIPYTVVASDAAGNTIIGNAPYTTAITPTTSDGTAFTFSPSSITSPNTAVTLQYNGNATARTNTFGATAGALTAPTISLAFTPAALGITCSAGCTNLTNATTPYTLTVTEGGLNSAVTVSGSGASCNFDPSASVTMAGGSGSLNVYPNPAGGSCSVTVTDTYGQANTSNTTFNAAANPTIVSNCGAFTVPPDPNGGFLYIFGGCGSLGVSYGSYFYTALDSNQNPLSFQVAIYANPANPYIRQFTVGGNRYITAVAVSSPYVNFTGQSGTSQVPFASLIP